MLGDLGTVPRFGDQEINTPKLDWQLNPKQHVSVLYHRLRWDSPGGVQTQGTNNYAVDTFGTDFVKLDYGLAKLDSLFRPTSQTSFATSMDASLNDEGRQKPSAYTNQFLTDASGVPPEVSAEHLAAASTSARPTTASARPTRTSASGRSATPPAYSLGKHNIRFGEDIVHNYDLQNNLFEGNGYYTYSSAP